MFRLAQTITQETRHLVAAILAEARERGVPLKEASITTEAGHPVLRVRVGNRVFRSVKIRLPGPRDTSRYTIDVITVMGSAYRSSRMWPRNLQGWFRIEAIVDHLLGLVREEMSRPTPERPIVVNVPVGVPAAASGIYVIHAAAVQLGTVTEDTTPEDLVGRIKDDGHRARLVARAARGGLTDGDLRVLDVAAGLFFGRCVRVDFDPFANLPDRYLRVVRVGSLKAGQVERRYVLVLARDGDEVTVADPAGDGLVAVKAAHLEVAWKAGSDAGRPWVGTLSRMRRT